MSGTSTPARDEQLLSIGRQCAAAHCGLVDFLPYTCAHCARPHCAAHRLPLEHACTQYDAHAADRVAPDCPACGAPVAVAPGASPDAAMERHFERCAALTGKAEAARKGPVCAHKRCAKVLHAPIKCGVRHSPLVPALVLTKTQTCHLEFCPQHRFPGTHVCAPAPTPAAASGSSRPSSAAVAAAVAAAHRQAAAKAQQLGASVSAAARSASKPAPAPAPAPVQKTSAPAPPKKTGGLANPFSATDR
jgi:predicted nucleic acid binding AN1-type Zn finger protein